MVFRILIANRGEIAIRISRSVRDLGYVPLGIYTDVDVESYHRRFMDSDYRVSSYLNIDEIIEAAVYLGADAIHPGYGFLSENPEFARRVVSKGFIFIGPQPHVIEALGDKVNAKETAVKVGVPTLPYVKVREPEDVVEFGEENGYPLIIKAVGGGGGMGMRIVYNSESIYSIFEQARKEVEKAFGNPEIFVEPYIEKSKHIEVQVIGDGDNYVHLYERECSVQRRYQKIIEEAPSPSITWDERNTIVDAAIRLLSYVKYVNAGTVEFLYDLVRKKFYFMEVNTRLQVEHPITEMVTGVDIVAKQIEVALEGSLGIKQKDIVLRGHAIEARINAENPITLTPSPGKITYYSEPNGAWIRVDSGVTEGSEVPIEYNPLIAKLIVFGSSRAEALRRLNRALSEYIIMGVQTNIPLIKAIINHPVFIKGSYTTKFLNDYWNDLITYIRDKELLHAAIISSIVAKAGNMAKVVQTRTTSPPTSMNGLMDTRLHSLKRKAWFYWSMIRSSVRSRRRLK
ncbi:MAG: biotin carboxylase N-terminal domain-containing protein [Desulfurococcaceae archaeon]